MESDTIRPRARPGNVERLFDGLQPIELPEREPGGTSSGEQAPPDSDRMKEAAARRASQRYQLVLRFALFNLAGFALLGAAFGQGWIGHIIRGDSTYISVGIFVVFLGGLAACARAIWSISRELNAVQAPRPRSDSWTDRYLAGIAERDAGSRAIIANGLRMRLASRIAIVRYVANTLVLLGLIGTVLGFVIALSAIDPEVAGDVSRVAPMVAMLIQGMSVALYTTLVGAVLHLWLSANYHILAVGAATFATHLIARGEGYVRV